MRPATIGERLVLVGEFPTQRVFFGQKAPRGHRMMPRSDL